MYTDNDKFDDDDFYNSFCLKQTALLELYASIISKCADNKISNLDIFSQIKKVIFNNPATIILWNDGTKTVVEAHDEAFDKEKGLCMAIIKYISGNKGNYYNQIKNIIDENS